jgi:predicted nucleic acid-binding protein
MIAATAVANGLPLYTADVDDFKGLEGMLEVVEVRRG